MGDNWCEDNEGLFLGLGYVLRMNLVPSQCCHCLLSAHSWAEPIYKGLPAAPHRNVLPGIARLGHPNVTGVPQGSDSPELLWDWIDPQKAQVAPVLPTSLVGYRAQYNKGTCNAQSREKEQSLVGNATIPTTSELECHTALAASAQSYSFSHWLMTL